MNDHVNNDDTYNAVLTAEDLYPTPEPVMKHAYHNSLGSCKFIFKDGTEAPFTGGHYFTDDPDKIRELDNEVRLGHPHIYIDQSARTVNTAIVDPLDEVRRQAVEDALRRQAAISKANNMGNTEFSGKVEGIGNSDTVGAAASGSVSLDGAGGGIPDGTAGTVTSATGVPSAALAALKATLSKP